MPDRKRDASGQRRNRCRAGRQLQPGVARRLRAAFVGPFDVIADDGVRTRDLRFTKPLLYRLSYVGGNGQNIASSAAAHKRSTKAPRMSRQSPAAQCAREFYVMRLGSARSVRGMG